MLATAASSPTTITQRRWTTVARNLEVVVAEDPAGTAARARFSNGTVAIQQYQPMRADMQGWFTIDGGDVRFSRLDLLSDGAKTDLTGSVELTHCPSMTWNVSPA